MINGTLGSLVLAALLSERNPNPFDYVSKTRGTRQGSYDTFQAGKFNKCYDIDGAAGPTFDLGAFDADFLISCWVNIKAASDSALFSLYRSSDDGEVGLWYDVSGSEFYVDASFGSTLLIESTAAPSGWFHLALLRYNDYLSIWIDGSLGAEDTYTEDFSNGRLSLKSDNFAATRSKFEQLLVWHSNNLPFNPNTFIPFLANDYCYKHDDLRAVFGFPYTVEQSYDLYESTRKEGRALRARRNERTQRSFSLPFENMPIDEWLELKGRIDTLKNATFFWTPPGELDPVEVYLEKPGLSYERSNQLTVSAELVLRQVF